MRRRVQNIKQRLPADTLILAIRNINTALSTSLDGQEETGPWSVDISVVHLDVEDCSEELLRQHSYAIKNQLVTSKGPYRP